MITSQATDWGLEEDIIQNLKDAGCSQEMITCFVECMKQEDRNGQLRLMEEHRRCLLDKVHEEEKRIDCLDYLIYQIERSKDEGRLLR